MSTTTKTIGKVSVVPKGTWAAGTSYSRLDIVSYEGSSYIAAQDAPAGTPLANTSYWEMIASIGSPAPSAIVASAAISATESWLTANISNPTNPVIDNTLSLNNAAANAKKAGAIVASYFSPGLLYDVGDFVNYQGSLYKCGVPVTSAGEWDGTHWIPTNTSLELSNVINNLNVLNNGGLELEEDFIKNEIDDWLAANPSYTTTVEDHSLSINKLIIGTLGYVTPEMFGAVGDGVTNDAAAINSAVQSGKPVILQPNTTYLLSSRIYIQDNMYIIGSNNSTLKWSTYSSSAADLKKLGGESKTNLYFENIIFDFGSQVVATYDISLLNCSFIKFINCKFYNSYGSAFRINGSDHILIQGCHFENITGISGAPGEAIFGSNFHDAQIIDCTCNNIGDHFLYADGSVELYNVTVSGCVLNGTGMNGLTNGGAICLYSNVHDATVSDCVINPHGAGIFIGAHGGSDLLGTNIVVSNCTINGGNIGISIYGLTNSNLISGIKVTGCAINGCSSDGLDVRYGKNIILSNCILKSIVRCAVAVDSFFYSVISDLHISDIAGGAAGIIIGTGRTNSSADYNIINSISLSGNSSNPGLYPFYNRVGLNNLIDNIITDNNFQNENIYPPGYGVPISYSKQFTPEKFGGTAEGNVTFSSGRSYYAVSGKMVIVHVEGKIDTANEGTYIQISGFPIPVTIATMGLTIISNSGLIGQGNLAMASNSTPVISGYFTSQNPLNANNTFKICAVGIIA